MWNFKTVSIDNVQEQLIERALRQFTAKRHTSLDLQSSSTYARDEKLFLGLENEKSLKLTRIRSPFESYLPKLIIRFDKQAGFTTYKIRYSLLPLLIAIFLSFAIICNIIYSVIDKEWDSDLLKVVLLFSIFLLSTAVEYNLTTIALRKALDKVR